MKQVQAKGNSRTNGFTRNSFKFISSCIKTVSSGVRSASSSISSHSHEVKDQVLWASFDRIELGPSSFKCVLLLGYSNGFQVLDVDNASAVSVLVSRHDDPCAFLQIQPFPAKSKGCEGFRSSHPLLLIAAGDETNDSEPTQRRDRSVRNGFIDSHAGNVVASPTAVRFYSLSSHNYVHVLRFRSVVYTVRCSAHIVAVGLASQIYCFDALTLENKFSVLTYPVPQMAGQGIVGINIGYGPMDVGTRWLAYASNNPLLANTGRLSPQSLTPSPGVSPSTSPSSGSLVARYAMESSKQLAAGLINLGDMGYKTLSKYCQELRPDGSSSPVASSSGWKVNNTQASSPDMETAGMVTVKDFVSKNVIAHFRAHTSPISALCFDPSGMLLVTASIHGNNINIFRIMPSCSQNGPDRQSYHCTSSHAHLYKLHRGITSAVIQDICFSQYSQWVAVVSSKGTCHIYVLSPFGGDCGLQVQNSHADGPTLVPVLSSPWWSTSSYTVNQKSFSVRPPAPVTLSVVCRIRTGNSGWLNTVSNAASLTSGMVSVPSCAASAVFHCSMANGLQSGRSKTNSLEHLLVYSPSGHLIQYELLPSLGLETTDSTSRTGTGSHVHIQDEDLKVKAEPIQWWDVCRKADWPEREVCITGINCGRKDSEIVLETSECKDNVDIVEKGHVPHERYAMYLSNTEVQSNFGKLATWQNSMVHFFTMDPGALPTRQNYSSEYSGEIEIERVPHLEIEVKQRDLLPVFAHLHNLKPDWSDRYTCSKSEAHVQKCNLGTSLPAEQMNTLNSDLGLSENSDIPSPRLIHNFTKTDDSLKDRHVNSLSSSKTASPNSVLTSEASNVSSNRSDFSMNVVDEDSVQDHLDFEGCFEEEYCKANPSDEGHEMSEVVTDVHKSSGSSLSDKEKSPEEDGENDEMLGGIFGFSE